MPNAQKNADPKNTAQQFVSAPTCYRLLSLMRLPGKKGQGIYNEAVLYHERESLRVCWASASVDSRLRRGDLVTVKAGPPKGPRSDLLPVVRIVRLDRPEVTVNPFEMVPTSWLNDPSVALRAKALWGQMERPLQHLLNAVLWDGARFYRYVAGPVSSTDYPAPPGGNFRRAVALAEEALSLADGLPSVARGVLIAAALLHTAGKADDFRLAADGTGFKLSERGVWIGYQQTILEWLAIARTQVIIPDACYYHLVHVLIALRRPLGASRLIETAVLNAARHFVDSPENLWQTDGLIPFAQEAGR